MSQESGRVRVLFACSAGGHLAQLLRLEPWYRDHDVRWVTFDLPDAVSLLPDDAVVWAYHPTTRSLKNLVRNAALAVREIARTRPQLIVSSGAAIAVPFFWIGKLFGAKTVYVEVIDRIDTRTLTGTARVARHRPDRRPGPRPARAVSRQPSDRQVAVTRVVVSVGTDHHPFDRMLEWIAVAKQRSDLDVLVQRGATAAAGRTRVGRLRGGRRARRA